MSVSWDISFGFGVFRSAIGQSNIGGNISVFPDFLIYRSSLSLYIYFFFSNLDGTLSVSTIVPASLGSLLYIPFSSSAVSCRDMRDCAAGSSR